MDLTLSLFCLLLLCQDAAADVADAAPATSHDSSHPDDATASCGRQRLLVGTAAHKLLLYDTAVGKRPQMSIDWGEARITALLPEPSGEYFDSH
eukprot:jgi/Chrzof1/6745/Cz19g07160.t1